MSNPISLDTQGSNVLNTGDGGGPSITSIQTNIVTPSDGDTVFAAAMGATQSGGPVGANPGGWNVAAFVPGFWKQFPAGALSVAQTLNGSYNALQIVLAFRTKTGQVPVWTSRGSGSGGTVLTLPAFTPTKGNSLLWVVAGSVNGNSSMSNTAGANWGLLASFGATSTTGGFVHQSQFFVWYAENVPAVNMSPSLTVPQFGGGTWGAAEISGLDSASNIRLLASLGVGV